MIRVVLAVITIVSMSIVGDAAEMSGFDSEEDVSMMFYDYDGVELIDEGLAIEIARRLVVRLYGKAELSLQEPLVVEKDDKRWIVRGSRVPYSEDKDVLMIGPVELIINRRDGKIVKFVRNKFFSKVE